jgi:hypothetical protein
MMTTCERQRNANRRNAQLSSGPRTKRGKTKVRKNALRHGLAAAPSARVFPKPRVNAIVAALVGLCNDPGIRETAEKFALAHLSWMQTEAVRQKVIKQKLKTYHRIESSKGNDNVSIALVLSDPEVMAIDRYERRAFSRRQRAAKALMV